MLRARLFEPLSLEGVTFPAGLVISVSDSEFCSCCWCCCSCCWWCCSKKLDGRGSGVLLVSSDHPSALLLYSGVAGGVLELCKQYGSVGVKFGVLFEMVAHLKVPSWHDGPTGDATVARTAAARNAGIILD